MCGVRTSLYPCGRGLLGGCFVGSVHGIDSVAGAEVVAHYFGDGDAATDRAGGAWWMFQGVFHSYPECGGAGSDSREGL